MQNRGNGAIAKPLCAKLRFPLASPDLPAPYTGKVAPGSITLFNGMPVLIACAVSKNSHRLTEGYIQVHNSRMSPTRRKGSWIGIQRVKPGQILHFGFEYLLVNKDYTLLLCRIYPPKYEGCIEVRFDNKRHISYHIPVDPLKALFLVEPVNGWLQ